jgi:hypothetical protein
LSFKILKTYSPEPEPDPGQQLAHHIQQEQAPLVDPGGGAALIAIEADEVDPPFLRRTLDISPVLTLVEHGQPWTPAK